MKTLIPLTRLVARCMAATILALPQASMAEAPLTRESVAQRIQAGEIASNPLFLPDAERRIIFANTAFFAPTRRVSAGVNTRQFTQSHRDFSDVRYEVVASPTRSKRFWRWSH